MADSSFTTSVIMAGWVGSMALASSARHFSSPRILSKPYWKKKKHKPKFGVIQTTCSCNTMKQFQLNKIDMITYLNHSGVIGFKHECMKLRQTKSSGIFLYKEVIHLTTLCGMNVLNFYFKCWMTVMSHIVMYHLIM